MVSQPVSSIFPCSPLPSGTWRTPGLSIPWCCLLTSSSACFVFFPLSLYLSRWFWPDRMNGRHDHTTAVCVSLRSSGTNTRNGQVQMEHPWTLKWDGRTWAKQQQRKDTRFSSVEKRINTSKALHFLFTRTLWTLSWDVAKSPAGSSPSIWEQSLSTSQ